MPDFSTVHKQQYLLLITGFLVALSTGALAYFFNNYAMSLAPAIVLLAAVLCIAIFKEPFFGLISTLVYTFIMGVFSREVAPDFPVGLGIEILLILTLISVWYHSKKYNLALLKSDLFFISTLWLLISVLQLVNPAGASPSGWLQEIRSAALIPFMVTILGLLLIYSSKTLNYFLKAVIVLSFITSVYGIKQFFIGPSAGEQRFLDGGGGEFHIINGVLRVFSFLSDASQFGALQAFSVVIGTILFFATKSPVKKTLLVVFSGLSFYGLLISGTRGGFFILIAGFFLALLLSKNKKALFLGGIAVVMMLGVLKFTYIGNTNYSIYRLRTAVNPQQDASFTLRLQNQATLRNYLATKPFGGGLGSIGTWGRKYNADKYLSTIAPDSYWVKVWAMYGITGLVVFFCSWMYLIGNCCGMIWRVKDKYLKARLIALMAGVTGVFAGSYGNEFMNLMPLLLIVNLSLAAVYGLCRRSIEKETAEPTEL